MNIRAVIFDIYGTLLEVGPPPVRRPACWERLWRDSFHTPPRLTLAGFSAACDAIIAREHGQARARGIPCPEIYWPSVAAEVLPELSSLSPEGRAGFLFEQTKLWHTVRMTAETAARIAAGLHEVGLSCSASPPTPKPTPCANCGRRSQPTGWAWTVRKRPLFLVLRARLQQTRPARLPNPHRPPRGPRHPPAGDSHGWRPPRQRHRAGQGPRLADLAVGSLGEWRLAQPASLVGPSLARSCV